MISCYSLDPDVLSQWRAYADDGRGFAIEFSAKLMQMPAKKLRVLYDEERQRDGRAHITTSRVIVTWNHIEIGIGGEASITAGAMPAVLGQIGFVGTVVV